MAEAHLFTRQLNNLMLQERFTEELVNAQIARGRNVYPIRKAKSKMGLGLGPPSTIRQMTRKLKICHSVSKEKERKALILIIDFQEKLR